VRMDPPEHDRQRLMVTADFMVKQVRGLEPFLDELLDGMFEQMEASGGPVDLVEAVAEPLPAQVIARMLDLPMERGDFFLNRVRAWMSLDDAAQTKQAAEDILDYFDELITEREAYPGDDLVSRLVKEHMLTGELSRHDLKHMLHLLLIGGFDTTANMIALGTLVLLKHPDQLEEFKAHPELARGLVEELLRYLTVAHYATTRVAVEDIEAEGQCIRSGEGIITPLMAANRDPHMFTDPDRFDIHRDARGHLAFGYGVHQCLGQALARVELQVTFRRLFDRFPTMQLAVDERELEYTNATIYGLKALPVTW
jgi:cytochrome P450